MALQPPCHFHQVRAQLAPSVLSTAAGRALHNWCHSAAQSKACSHGAQKEGASEVLRPPPHAPRLWYASTYVGEPGPAQPPAHSQTCRQLPSHLCDF